MSVTITFIADDVGSARGEMRQLLIGDAGFFMVASPKTEQLTAEPVPDDEKKAFPEVAKPKRAGRAKPVELEEVAVETAKPATRYFYHPESSSAFTTEDGSRPESGDGLLEEVDADRYALIQADLARDLAEEAKAEELAAETDTAKPEFSEDDVRKALVDLGSQANGKENCRAVLTQFGAEKLSEVKIEDRKAFIAAIAKLRGVS